MMSRALRGQGNRLMCRPSLIISIYTIPHRAKVWPTRIARESKREISRRR